MSYSHRTSTRASPTIHPFATVGGAATATTTTTVHGA